MQVRSATMVRCTAHAPYTCLFVTVLKFLAPIDTLLTILNHRIAIVGLGLSHLAVRERPRGGAIVGGDWQTGQPKGGHKSKVLPGCLPPPSPPHMADSTAPVTPSLPPCVSYSIPSIYHVIYISV